MHTTLTQAVTVLQPIVIPSIAWAYGFEDGAQGNSFYTGNDLFVGQRLVDYRTGWRHDRLVAMRKSMRQAKVQHGDPAVAIWEAEGAPTAGFTFDDGYRGTPAEDRDEYVGI